MFPVPVFRLFTDLDIEFTDGTVSLAGATGAATYSSFSEPFSTPSSGIAGSVTVPAR